MLMRPTHPGEEQDTGILRSRREFLRDGVISGAATLASSSLYSRALAAERWRGPTTVAVDGLANPEDIAIIPGSDWIVTSGSAGGQIKEAQSFFVNIRTHEVRPAYPKNCAFDLDRDRFGDIAPPQAIRFHGLDVAKTADGAITLYQVNHVVSTEPGHSVGRESIEVLQIDMMAHGPSLRWRGAIPLPSWVVGNDCCALPEGGVAVTNTAFGGFEGFPMMLAGKSSGQVLEWHDRKRGWSVVEGTDLNAPNGIAVSVDGKYFFICSWATKQFHRISRAEPHTDRTTINIGALADNVTWTPDGHLLVAGQMDELASLMKSAQAGTFGGAFRATKVEPSTMKATILLEGNLSGCIVSTALEAREGEIWLGDIGLENKLLFYQL
jgi:hypothetical protein